MLAQTFALIRNVVTKNYAVPDEPYMPKRNVVYFADALRSASCYLEFGAGGSTILAARMGLADVVSVESDPTWLERVDARLKGDAASARTHLLPIDIGPTRALGYPAGKTHEASFRDYPLGPWRYCAENGLSPDLVLIDGRFRLACMLATLRHARPGCRVLFDDYRWRAHYHGVERFVRPVAMIGRMAEFRVPEGAPGAEVDAAFEVATADPR